jgi:4-hydroxy-4-methyl-2-oxoglutarate aldolase
MQVNVAMIGCMITTGFMSPAIKPVNDHMKIIGRAYTVRITQRDSSALHYALQKASKSSVIVIDRAGDRNFACVDEFLAEMAKACGMNGIVVDGPVAGKIALQKLDFPVFCTGFSPVVCDITGTSGEVGIPIDCGGAVVNNGDIIFGDADGVIVIPEDFMLYLKRAEKKANQEQELRTRIKNGFVYDKRSDFDVVKFYEYGVSDELNKIRDIKCQYEE